MRVFFTIISYLFHPIFMPVGGTVAYFLITPKHTPLEIQAGTILPIFILTIIIPIITYLILKNIGVVHSIFQESTTERRYFLAIHIVLFLMILYKVIPNNYIIEVYFYFVGLAIAAFASFLMVFFNTKTSLPLTGLGGLLMYLISLSIHFEINIVIGLSLLLVAIGITSSASLYLKSHTIPELTIGLCIGMLSQLLTVTYWL